MAWVATEDFDSYLATDDIDGGSGGSGWSGNWAKVSGAGITAEVAPAGGQGGNAANSNTGGTDNHYTRAFSAISAGIFSIRMRVDFSTMDDYVGFVLLESGTGRIFIRFTAVDNQIQLYNGGTPGYEDIQGYSVDTWYTIDVEFDDAAQPNKFRVRIDGGSWTSWIFVLGSSYSTLSVLRLDDSSAGTHEVWWDDIKDGAAPVGATSFPPFMIPHRAHRSMLVR